MRRSFWIIGLIAGIILGIVGLDRYYASRIYPGINAANVAVGGLSKQEAIKRIEAATRSTQPPQLTLKAGDKTLSLSASELGWQPDAPATAERAFAVGRRSLSARFAALGGISIPLVPKVDTKALEARLKSLAQSLEYPATNAKVAFKDNAFVIIADKPGLKLDIQSALSLYRQYPDRRELEFFPRSVSAKVSVASLQDVVASANTLLRPLTLRYPEPSGKVRQRSLNPVDIAGLLQLGSSLSANTATIRTLLSRTAARFDRLPVEARYVLRQNQLVARQEVDGWKMNQPQALSLLAQELFKPEVDSVTLPVVAKQASVRAADLPQVERLELLAEATTYFGGSAGERIANVHAAARNLNGYIVPAGGVFNFNNAIGSISPENGFREALVISGGRTIKGVGGGVCQVSTTAFRALYQAGMPIIERNQHAYKVRWYDAPFANRQAYMGYDAAVYQPYLNLRANNDTPGPLVVRTNFNNSSLTVRLFGISDGRKVQVSRPAILWRTRHPGPQYIFDASLGRGQVKQVDWAVDGYRTRITRTITTAAGNTTVQYLNSNFRPWRAVYQYGPGASIGRATASR
jgi:vancomycin resistance protein YoaR